MYTLVQSDSVDVAIIVIVKCTGPCYDSEAKHPSLVIRFLHTTDSN